MAHDSIMAIGKKAVEPYASTWNRLERKRYKAWLRLLYILVMQGTIRKG